MSYLSERAEAVQVWLEGDWTLHYRKRGDRRWRGEALVRRLHRRGVCATELDGWEALRELSAAGVIETSHPVSAHQRLNATIALSEALRHRLESEFVEVDDSLALEAGQAAVWRHALDGALQGWSVDDQRRLATGLRALGEALPGAYAMSAFEASARFLLGSSKLLPALPRELVRAFGIDTSSFRGPAAWVLAAVPAAPEGLLLIENPQSFEQACRLGLGERFALVCSFGYGLSLDKAMGVPERIRLIGEGGGGHALDELLALPNPTFWGDLDPEGLRIFLRLRRSVTGLRLSALYAPMIALLENAGGHPLIALTGKAGQRPAGAWACGVDQEVIDDATLVAHAGRALDAALERAWLTRLGEAEGPPGAESP